MSYEYKQSLVRRLEEMRALKLAQLAEAPCADYAEYKARVSYIMAIKHIEDLVKEAFELHN